MGCVLTCAPVGVWDVCTLQTCSGSLYCVLCHQYPRQGFGVHLYVCVMLA